MLTTFCLVADFGRDNRDEFDRRGGFPGRGRGFNDMRGGRGRGGQFQRGGMRGKT